MKSIEKEFLNVIEENQGIVHKVCNVYTDNNEDHHDLFQEILLQLWKGYSKFRGESKFTTWMYRVSLYTAISIFKKKKRRNEISEDSYREIVEETEDPYRFESLNMAIATLSATDKALITLYLDEKPYKEIAEIIDISESNVGVKLNRIKKKLKLLLEKI